MRSGCRTWRGEEGASVRGHGGRRAARRGGWRPAPRLAAPGGRHRFARPRRRGRGAHRGRAGRGEAPVGGSRTRRAGDARGRARAAPPRAREGDDGRLPSTHTLPSIELSGASATVEAPLPPPSTAVAGEWRRRRPARPMARLMVRRMGVCVGGWGAAASEAAGQSAATVRSEGGAARAAAALAACPGATTRSASVGRPSPSRRRRRRLSMTTDYGAPPRPHPRRGLPAQ